MRMFHFNEGVRYLILDTFSGLDIMSNYKIFTNSFSWSRERVIEHQNRKLKSLLSHAFHNVPYYHELFESSGIMPDDIKSVEDLQKIPVLTRDLLRDNYEELKDARSIYRKQFPASSSGTTGTPIKYVHDRQCESAGIAAGYALYHLSGWSVGRRRLHIWGNPTSIIKWQKYTSRAKRIILKQKNYPAYLLNDPENYQDLLSLIRAFKPEFIDGYAGPIGSFACWLRDMGIKTQGIKTVFTTAENLTPGFREVISEVLGPVSDLYGSGEINGIAIQPVFSDRYIILESHVIVEEEEFNGSSELIITDLDARLMPLIRYKIGDVVDRIHKPAGESDGAFSYFHTLDGRTTDFIKLNNGKVIHPVNILGGTFLRKYPEIRRHKVIWDGEVLNFVLEVSGNIDLDLFTNSIIENLRGFEVEFKVTLKEKLLPSANGKFKYLEIIYPDFK